MAVVPATTGHEYASGWPLIQEKAKDLAVTFDKPEFKASSGWLTIYYIYSRIKCYAV